MKWWEIKYTQKFNKLLKSDLQQLCIDYEINPNQHKKWLVIELMYKMIPQDYEEIDLGSPDEITEQELYPRRSDYSLPYEHCFELDGRQIMISDSIRQHEEFLRNKVYEMSENYINHGEIKLQINSILDVVKKPNTFPIDQPSNIIPILLNHQKQNIQWMKNLEDDIDNHATIEISNIMPYMIPLHPQIIHNCYNYRNYFHYPKKNTFTFEGGILADEMGLGKSITCVSLAVTKPREPKNNMSKANLVLCPSHLAQQWFDEIEQHTIGLKVCMIRTKKDWDCLTYYDLMTSDIVIVTHQFLVNPHYNDMYSWIDYDQPQCSLSKIHWHRIFLDEGHELVYNTKMFNTILKLQATYKWFVSGTPFIDGATLNYPDICVYRISKFLGIPIREYEVISPNSIHCIRPNLEYMQAFVDKLMIRNTKESANIQLPQIHIEDKLLNFHKTERGRYDIAVSRPRTSKKWLLQLCCSLNLADQDIKEFGIEKTLEQIHEIMIENQEKILEKKKNTLEHTIPKREETVITEERKQNIERLTREIKEIERSLQYLKIVLKQINQEQSCPVCLEVIEDLAITECGHVFCVNCIEQCLNTNGKCPNCRTKTNYMIVGKENPENNEMINQYGTKITELIEFLKQHSQEKVIIFSQWDRLLHKVGDILKEEGYPNVFCQGPIFQRNKCLQEFRKKNIQILMMSLHYAVSGTNLTEATQVVILDIYDGSKEDIEKKEGQAIGRVHRLGQTKEINVTRFIMKDTIEEDLYKKLINNNEIIHNEVSESIDNDFEIEELIPII